MNFHFKKFISYKERIQYIGKQEDNANDYATGRVSSSMQETPNTMIRTNRKMINNCIFHYIIFIIFYFVIIYYI